jgi:RNA polymerase sigma-70 factor (ECF subfamily)
VSQRIDAQSVRAALGSLPPVQREAITLAYFSGLTQQEIAQRTDAPLGTVKSRVRLGLLQLRRVLGDEVSELESDMATPQGSREPTHPEGAGI